MKNLKKIALFASIFSSLVTSILINNLFYSKKKKKKLCCSISRNPFLNIPYPVNFSPKYPVSL